MGARRFFVDGIHGVGERVALTEGDARKAILVLRLRSGDDLEICDSTGRTFAARLVVDGARAAAELLAQRASVPAARLEIVLAQALPKGQKMDFVVEKATELGVARIVPLITERSLEGAPEAKLDRWRRLARTAAQQSGRADVPAIDAPSHWRELFAPERAVRDDRATIVPWEVADRAPLRDRLPSLLTDVASVVIAIGPEGGLSHEEVAYAEGGGAHVVSLGHRILRAETAGLVACAVVRYAAGDL